MEGTNDLARLGGFRFCGVLLLIVVAGFQPKAPAAEAVGPAAEVVTAIIDDVADGTRHFDEPALYLLLDRLRAGGGPVDVEAGKPFRHADLIAGSAALRGTRVAVGGRFVESERVQLSNRRRHAEPVYVTLMAAQDTGDPLQVVTLLPPPALSSGTPVRASGYYFKYRRDESRSDAGIEGADDVLVPIVVARRLIVPGGARSAAKGERWGGELVVILVLVLGLIYYGVRRKARRSVRPGRDEGARSRAVSGEPAEHHRPIDLDAFGQGLKKDTNESPGE